MLEPPSKELLRRLEHLKLCTPADVRGCRRVVKRFARDVPAFDSVWIDALIQSRKLTLFQAGILESAEPDRLEVGPCVLVDELGHSSIAKTFLAQRRRGNDRCVLKLIEQTADLNSHCFARLEGLAGGLKSFTHPSIVGPHSCLQSGGRLVTVSRYVPGPHLGELLVRRGRFPPAIVWEIGRQLAEGLSALESAGLFHGDVCLANIRLTSAGTVVLVDAGIRSAVSPEVSARSNCPPARYDGTAPERIATGNPATAKSDMYALGCMLWQLLAGRPPFPTGDPLAKLAAHQTRPVSDIREWSPETPESLAENIITMTARDADQRPDTFRALCLRMGKSGSRGRRRLSKFRALFNTRAPRIPVTSAVATSSRWPMWLLLLFVLSGACLTMLDQGMRSDLLALGHRTTRFVFNKADGDSNPVDKDAVEPQSDTPRVTVSFLPLPAPDPDGNIRLNGPGPYATSDIAMAGALTIRGKPGTKPEIIVGAQPLRIWAERLVLENVHIRRDFGSQEESPAVRQSKSLVLVQSQNLLVRGCSFQNGETGNGAIGNIDNEEPGHRRHSASNELPIAIAWKVVDAADRSGSGLVIRDSVFFGKGTSLFLSTTPETIVCENCLKLGAGSFVAVGSLPHAGRELLLELKKVTIRNASAMLRLRPDEARLTGGRIRVVADDCVFDLRGPTAALLHAVSNRNPQDWLSSTEVTGQGCLATSGLETAIWFSGPQADPVVLDPSSIAVEGISTAAFRFNGPLSFNPTDSEVKSFQASRRSQKPPGIDAEQLPVVGVSPSD